MQDIEKLYYINPKSIYKKECVFGIRKNGSVVTIIGGENDNPFSGAVGIEEIAIGEYHGLALTKSGNILAKGFTAVAYNQYGQCDTEKLES